LEIAELYTKTIVLATLLVDENCGIVVYIRSTVANQGVPAAQELMIGHW
jgi:hypothetical protein